MAEHFATVLNTIDKGPAIVPFGKFLRTIGRSRTTGWRWRRLGWIDVVTIAGRPYVRREDIETFVARARRGEFAQAGSSGSVH